MNTKIDKKIMDLPNYCFDWCQYKGEVYFALPNYERSVKAKAPMIDLHYCVTKCFNGLVLKTVKYIPELFSDTIKYN